jgi:hypothetical protein
MSSSPENFRVERIKRWGTTIPRNAEKKIKEIKVELKMGITFNRKNSDPENLTCPQKTREEIHNAITKIKS